MAAHAAHTKADAHVHGAHGAQSAAVPAGEAVLFANLLAQMGEADQSDAGTGKGSTDPEKLLDAHASAGNSKKIKDHADDTIGQFADLQAMPAHLAVLNAKFASAIGETAHSKHDKADKKADPVDALDAAKDAGNAKQILNRILEAKTGNNEPAKNGKKAPAETIVTADTQPLVPPAASAAAAPSVTEPAKGRNAPAKHSDAVKDVQAADAAKTAIVPSDNAAEADTKADAKAKDSKDAKVDTAKDAASQTAIADKAEAFAAAADKTVRQGAASQGPQARALPLHLEAQVAASQSGNGGKTGGDGNSAHPQGQHAKIDTDTQPREDTPQAAAPTPLNNASATQSAAHTQTQTANVQPVTAQGQTQTSSPVVAASLQVAPQTAQTAAQPDIAALAVQIAAKSDDGNKQFDIRLDPQELGRVEVKLTIDDQGRAQAHLAVEKPQTLDMLQNDRGNLERALKDSGIALSQNGLNFSLKGQERQQGDNTPSFRGRSRSLAVTAAIESASAATAASTNSFVAGNARLDIHV